MGLKLDLHTHSRYSDDSLLEPADIIRVARARGLDGVAVTDHMTAAGGFEAKSHAGPGFLVIPGVEYATEAGHVLGLFIRSQPVVPSKGGASLLTLEEAASAIHRVGGIAVLAHPFEGRKRLPDGLFAGGLLDAAEVFNARADASRNPWANAQARNYASDNGIPATGGSDAHFAWEIGRGGCEIAGLGPGASLEDVRQAILDGRAVPFGRPSCRAVVPLTGLVKAWKTRRFGKMPKVLSRLVLALLGPPGRWLERAVRGPLRDR